MNDYKLTVIKAILLCLTYCCFSCGDDTNDVVSKRIETNTDDILANKILGSWKHSFSTGYELLTFKEHNNLVYEKAENGKKVSYNTIYSFDVQNMRISSMINSINKVWIVNSLTTDVVILNGDSYYKYTEQSGNDGKDPVNPPVSPSARGPVASSFQGTGTKDDPYIISGAPELRKLSDDVEAGKDYDGKFFLMTNDIVINSNVLNNNGDLNGNGSGFEEWKPIGLSDAKIFKGTFDGNGHSISGIFINSQTEISAGLFGQAKAVIKNLTLKDSYIHSPGVTGGILGRGVRTKNTSGDYSLSSYGTITGCHNYATVISDTSSVGGIVAEFIGDHITKCTNHGKVKGERAGGIASKSCGYINTCANYGRIEGGNYAAGICQNPSRSTITILDEKYTFYCSIKNSYNAGDVVSKKYSAGIYLTQASSNASALIRNCLNTGYIEGTRVGGIGYSASGTVYNCVNAGEIGLLSDAEIGGVVYYMASVNTDIQYCYYRDDFATVAYLKRSSKSSTEKNNKAMSVSEMKEPSFLEVLNKKVTSTGYSNWVTGVDGLPRLQNIEDLQ